MVTISVDLIRYCERESLFREEIKILEKEVYRILIEKADELKILRGRGD